MSQEGFIDQNDPYHISDSELVAFLEDYAAEEETSHGNASILQHPVNDKTSTIKMSGAVPRDTLKTITNLAAQEHKKASGEHVRTKRVNLQPRRGLTSSSPMYEVDVATINHNGTDLEPNQSLQIIPASSGGELKRSLPFIDTTSKKPKYEPKREDYKTDLKYKSCSEANRELGLNYDQNINVSNIQDNRTDNKNVSSKPQHANILMDNDEAQFFDMPLGGSNDTAHNPPPHGDAEEMTSVTGILQHISHKQRDFPKFNSVMHIVHFRFVNLDRIQSFLEAVDAVHSAIETLLDRVLADVNPGDFVQLRLKGGDFLDHLFSFKYSHTDLKAEVFLNSIVNSLHSNGECLNGVTLKLIATIMKNRRGGAKRRLKSVAYSQIIKQKKQWLYDFNNSNSNLCLAASIYALLADSDIGDAVIMSRATQLHKDLSIPDNQLVSFNDIASFEKYLGINIKVLYHNQNSWQYYHTDSSPTGKNVYILHHDNHYYGIKNMKGFLGERYFCQQCSSVFHHKNSHSCKYFCKACQRDDCVESSSDQAKCPSCPICRVVCRSSECFEQHQRLANDNKMFCKPKTFCDSCMRYVGSNIDHECKGLSCSVCRVCLDRYSNHQCYMQPYTPPEKTEKYIIYSYECELEEDTRVPNFIYCATLHGDVTWEFEGKECLQEFVKFFTKGKFKGFTFIAHDAGRYDAPFVVQALIKEKLQVKLITQGCKLLCLSLPDLKMRFIDFLNFLPVSFHNLTAMMGFPGSIGYFPQSFITKANQTYVGPLPSMEYYGVDHMTHGDRKVFVAWYEEHKNTRFDLKSELRSHCTQTVEILRKACKRYRDCVMETSKKPSTTYCKLRKKYLKTFDCVDPFQLISAPSVSMAMYRFNFLTKDTIAILPSDKYHKTQKRTSTPAIQWLTYVAHTENINIQHALNGGEKRVGKYSLDGYAHVDGMDIAFQFLWCVYYGCPVCHNTNSCNDASKSTHSQTYHIFLAKKQYLLRCGYTVRALWEHEWNEMLKSDGKLQVFLHIKKFPTPLDPRDALYGGKTMTIKQYHKAGPGETIHHYHFASLYPFVNKTKTYPVGHPEIIFENFGPINQYFGIAKVKVYPPRGLFFPVLPMRINKKLVFTLCYRCAANLEMQSCSHNDEERSLTGTWCTIELQMAVEKGYRIGHIYEIWNFPNTAEDLFAPYIKLHSRNYQEALGYPSWCTDYNKKKQYIDTVLEKEGIQLRADNIMADPAKRQISDLFINSLWGKFGQRSDLPQSSIVTDPDKLFRYVFQPSYDISELNIIDEETAIVSWKFTKEHYKAIKNANIFIASFTMAHARLELYRLLDRLQERCLYHDADSVVFVSKDGEWNPPLNDHLGEMTSKVPRGRHITEFVSIGPNTYCYRLNTGEAILKVKGMTLDIEYTNDQGSSP